ncbi:hypothetical protein L6452_43545 [Arctium lappa]|uniref:Uncharacterized protein n=1 Tax=Arctium lappa TaxID=4217 RepID=A0ACB8XE10_ARCLA|nr:hypothetical protein L6452_43545 [Arctium lappa]
MAWSKSRRIVGSEADAATVVYSSQTSVAARSLRHYGFFFLFFPALLLVCLMYVVLYKLYLEFETFFCCKNLCLDSLWFGIALVVLDVTDHPVLDL